MSPYLVALVLCGAVMVGYYINGLRKGYDTSLQDFGLFGALCGGITTGAFLVVAVCQSIQDGKNHLSETQYITAGIGTLASMLYALNKLRAMWKGQSTPQAAPVVTATAAPKAPEGSPQADPPA